MIYKDLTFKSEIFQSRIFKLQFWGLRVFGCIVCDKDNFKCLHFLKGVVNFIVLLIGVIFEIIFFTMYAPSIQEASLMIAIFIIYSVALIKTCFFCFYSKDYSAMINTVERSMLSLKNELDLPAQKLLVNFVNGSRRMSAFIASLVGISGFFTIAEGIFYGIIHFNDVEQLSSKFYNANVSLPKIFSMVPSWSISENFVVAYLLPCYMEFLGGVGLFLWTTFYTVLLRYAAFRLDIINYKLQHLAYLSNWIYYINQNFSARQAKVTLIDCMNEVVFVRQFVKNYQRVSRIPLFIELTSNTALMVMLMYQVSQISEFKHAGVLLPAIVSLFGMLFVYYSNADEISWKYDRMCTSLYTSSWYILPVDLQKEMLLFMRGCVNPLKLKAVLLYMDNTTFVMTIKTSYSYFTLLKNVASNN